MELFRQKFVFCLFPGLFFVISGLSTPAISLAKDPAEIMGLGHGAKDTSRLDTRMKGDERKTNDDRISEQRLGHEEKRLSREMREKDLLRAEEESRVKKSSSKMKSELDRERQKETDEIFREKRKKYNMRRTNE